MNMNITVSYSHLQIESLPAIAAACSRNVELNLTESKGHIVNMGPSCERIKSRNSILCFLLNVDPLDPLICTDLLWHEKYVKPILYQFYKSVNHNSKDESQINVIRSVFEVLDRKFGASLRPQLRPLELVLWGDLYLLLSQCSPFHKYMPNECSEAISKWFLQQDQFAALRRAADLVLGDLNKNITDLAKNVALYPVDLSAMTTSGCSSSAGAQGDKKEMKDVFLRGHADVSLPRVFASPRLPVKDARNILVTSALPYVNNVPHLGNLIGSTLSADVFARYCRVRGHNCIYVCGTDEYGTTTEVKAAEEKTTPRAICDHYHKVHADTYRWFNIDFDVFGRTSSAEHTEIVTEVFEQIAAKGLILEDSVTQLYCQPCDKFLADRLVEGVCPSCSFDDARGDQCDSCGKLINAVELIRPRCKMCGASPVLRSSTHLFLDLCTIQERLEEYLRSVITAPDCVWSTNAKAITQAWLKEGLKPRCITRDLKWGVPVPREHLQGKVFYVWFDAVLGYLSITARYTEHWRQWWSRADAAGPVELYQFMAKDNVPFHSVILPANMLATGRDYTMIRQLASTEYLNYESSKFSKSRGLGVFGTDAQQSGIDADVWRFYLVSCRPESQDSSFLWDEFATRNNSELLGNLGNFINRALSFVARFFDGLVPDFCGQFDDAVDLEFVEAVNRQIESYVDCMDQLRLRDALAVVLKISSLGNGYIQKNKPWVDAKADETKARAGTTIGVAANVACLLGVLLAPVMPVTADRILAQCAAPENCRQILDDCRLRAFLQPNHRIGEVVPLFQKMEPEFISEMKKRYSSS